MLHWHRKRKGPDPDLERSLVEYALRHRGDGAIAALGVVLEFDKRGMAKLKKRLTRSDVEGIIRQIIAGGLVQS
jgi:hypothetical protein